MILGLDIGGTFLKYAYMDQEGTIYEKGKIDAKTMDNLDAFIQTIVSLYHHSEYEIEGIATGVPGVVDVTTGVVEAIVAYPYLKGKSITKLLSKQCDGKKVTAENDAKCAALAELWKGNAKGCQDVAVIVFGTGIGGAIIKDGAIHYGFHKSAGEFSTMIVGYEDGKPITFADQASTKALCRKVEQALHQPLGSVHGEQIFTMTDDPKVKAILHKYYMDIATALYNIQYMYDPECICIGGGISKQPAVLKGTQEAILSIHSIQPQIVLPKVTVCKYYNDANLIGAFVHYKKVRESSI